MGAEDFADDATSQEERPLLSRGQVVAGRYRVIAPYRRGGMSQIFRAEQIGLGRVVALKVMDPRCVDRRRFVLEAETSAKLKHVNTVTVFDYGTHEENGVELCYIAMELLEGITLSDLLRDEGRLEVGHALSIAQDIARSLREAHGLGIVHRDLKPSNVILVDTDEGESARVLDFGIAKSIAEEQELTRDGDFLGSPRFMSPEQIQQEPVDGRSDIYSLGVLLYVMIGGRYPFDGQLSLQTLMAQVTRPPPSLSEHTGVKVARPIELLVSRCLQKSPDDRFHDMEEFLSALAAAQITLDSGPALVAPIPSVRASAPPPKKNLVLPGVTALLCVLVLVWLVIQPTTASPEPDAPPAAAATPPSPHEAPRETAPAPTPPVTLTVESTPPGATVHAAGAVLGTTPTEIPLDDGTLDLDIVLDGYAPVHLSQAASDRSVVRHVHLARVTPAGEGAEARPGGAGSDAMGALGNRAGASSAMGGRGSRTAEMGALTLVTSPWSRVLLGAEELGTTPLMEVPVAAGRHTLRLVNEEAGIDTTYVVEIQSGETTSRRLGLRR